jgi:hypothetical protein
MRHGAFKDRLDTSRTTTTNKVLVYRYAPLCDPSEISLEMMEERLDSVVDEYSIMQCTIPIRP